MHFSRAIERGFSLVELMLATAILVGVALITFQLFLQNEQAFRDQTVILEMQQNLRAVASMIAHDIRKAGQGVPVHASSYEATPSEAVAVFLDGTNANVLRFRGGVRNGVARGERVQTFSINGATDLKVDPLKPPRILDLVGAGTGRHVFLSGPSPNGWTWVRAEIMGFPSQDTIQINPQQISSEGGSFQLPYTVTLEEGISYRLASGRVLRGVTRSFVNLTDPSLTESTLADGFTRLEFTYLDASGTTIDPTTLDLRFAIRQIAFDIAAETAEPLADGNKHSLRLSLTLTPRNLQNR